MADYGPEHPFRATFSDLSDADFETEVRRAEILHALSKYFRQAASKIELPDNEVRLYDQNPSFPFPIASTAFEIADVVLRSFGSFDSRERQEALATESSPSTSA